jgi:PiT family inorganic phosphate transporter
VDLVLILVVITIAVALAFDVINGFHDAANSIATVVSTRVLSMRAAVVWAAFFNFAAMFVLPVAVAKTVAKTVRIDPNDSAFVLVVLGGLIGAIAWDLLTWWWGLPTSSSHALIGGLAGAGVMHAGWGVLQWESVRKTLIFIPIAPLIGFVIAYVLFIALAWTFRRWRPGRVDSLFRKLQLVSAAAYSLGHGGNDAQKTMGVIVAVLIASGRMSADFGTIPMWIILSCHAAMALGTAFGGWRIVKTMGMKITKLQPPGGFCAETAGAIALFGATHMGIPVSTTHTITGSIIGVGASTNLSGVKWGVATRILWAWLLTIPASALVAAGSFWLLEKLLG